MAKDKNPPDDEKSADSKLAVSGSSQEIMDEIRQIVPKSKDLDTQEIAQIVQIVTQHSGPLPSPNILRQYGDIIPSGVDRIVKMAESDQAHVQQMQLLQIQMDQRNHDRADKALAADQFYRVLSLITGFVALIAMLGTAAYLIVNGHDIAGGLLGGTTIIGVVSAFILGGSKAQVLDKPNAQKSPKIDKN